MSDDLKKLYEENKQKFDAEAMQKHEEQLEKANKANLEAEAKKQILKNLESNIYPDRWNTIFNEALLQISNDIKGGKTVGSYFLFFTEFSEDGLIKNQWKKFFTFIKEQVEKQGFTEYGVYLYRVFQNYKTPVYVIKELIEEEQRFKTDLCQSFALDAFVCIVDVSFGSLSKRSAIINLQSVLNENIPQALRETEKPQYCYPISRQAVANTLGYSYKLNEVYSPPVARFEETVLKQIYEKFVGEKKRKGWLFFGRKNK